MMLYIMQINGSHRINLPLTHPKPDTYMIFNGKNTQETNLVKLGNTCIERVWSKGNEKAFKLVVD